MTSGYKKKPDSFSNTSSDVTKEHSDNPDIFYARFDTKDNYSTHIDELKTLRDNDNYFDTSEHAVRIWFEE